MKRWSLAAATVASAALFLSACGGSGGGGGRLRAAAHHPQPATRDPPPASAAPRIQARHFQDRRRARHLRQRGRLRENQRHLHRRGRPEGRAQRHHPGPALAPLNANGKVEYTSDFVLFKPKDMAKASGVLRYDAPNRGNIVNLDPYFASRGYVFLTAAWQGDVPAGGQAHAQGARGEERRRQQHHRHLPRRAAAHGGHQRFAAAARWPLQRRHAGLRDREPGQHPARLRAHAPHQRGRCAPAHSRQRVEVCQVRRAAPFPGTPDETSVCLKDNGTRPTCTSWSTSRRTRRSWAWAWRRCAT
jgi:hypothetical protein